ncbi:Rhodanese-like domain-containing protein [Phaeosphaeriaceae sp. PMI808]|nr:Rhodanese-like domain-containing protein [Phaeosphaeriaceae sp. PMI808]
MSNLTISDLTFISREDLAQELQATDTPSTLAIIDVRDSDHVGGHIRGSTWVPSNELDYKMPELLRTLKGKETVVFHCALSQQRGPNAALRYAREKARVEEGEGKEGEKEEEKEGETKKKPKQKVVVLSGGFTEWQEKYGADKGLTEGWEKSIWEWGTEN